VIKSHGELPGELVLNGQAVSSSRCYSFIPLETCLRLSWPQIQRVSL